MSEDTKNPRKRVGGHGARMRDVAQRAGVSPMTVSRALNTPDRVSPEMRDRVERAVKEIGYLPNHLASSLSSNRSTTIGLIVDQLIGKQEVVLKSIEKNFRPIPGLSGASIQGDGRVSLILDVDAVINMAARGRLAVSC